MGRMGSDIAIDAANMKKNIKEPFFDIPGTVAGIMPRS